MTAGVGAAPAGCSWGDADCSVAEAVRSPPGAPGPAALRHMTAAVEELGSHVTRLASFGGAKRLAGEAHRPHGGEG